MPGHDATYVSLFSGGGGLDLGLELAGWHAAYASDFDPVAVATLQANAGQTVGGVKVLDGTVIEHADVTRLTGGEVLAKAGLRRGEAPLLAGGPPCQSWSSAGHQFGFSDPRGRLFDDFIRVAGQLDARWLLLENVRGLLTARGADKQPGSALLEIRHALLAAGYQTNVALLNAADFGVPQRRVRLFIIGFRSGDTPPFPAPTHTRRPDLGSPAGWVPLSFAIKSVGGLAPAEVIRPSGKMAADLTSVLPGSGVKSLGKTERTRPGGHWGYKQGAFVADPALPARTVTAGAAQDWVRDPELGLRRLCPRECAAVQGFPAEWRFEGGQLSQYRLIGNAVPPPLARAIGAQLLDGAGSHTPLSSVANLELLPLSPRLAYHVQYTAREEASNGISRRQSPSKRQSRLVSYKVDEVCL